MKIKVDISDDMINQVLIDMAESVLWHINYDLDEIRKYRGNDKPLNKMKDIQDNIEILYHVNKVIEYVGGTPVEIIPCEAKVGYDIHGKSFHQDD